MTPEAVARWYDMILVGRGILEEFAHAHAGAGAALGAWAESVEIADWPSPHSLKQRYPTVSILGNQRVVFNIKGNRYRLEAAVSFSTGVVRVLRVGTHDEYNKWKMD